ncbi:uncharacterized protein LOC134828804 [Culicoides brevitarsis]|uniref:uncharacterized protein LOC134828804 n=1 Tax=Culicoides brevitarsis TaxID=469753 RepID=UPI00307C3147
MATSSAVLYNQLCKLQQDFEQSRSNFKKTKDPKRRTEQYVRGKIEAIQNIKSAYREIFLQWANCQPDAELLTERKKAKIDIECWESYLQAELDNNFVNPIEPQDEQPLINIENQEEIVFDQPPNQQPQVNFEDQPAIVFDQPPNQQLQVNVKNQSANVNNGVKQQTSKNSTIFGATSQMPHLDDSPIQSPKSNGFEALNFTSNFGKSLMNQHRYADKNREQPIVTTTIQGRNQRPKTISVVPEQPTTNLEFQRNVKLLYSAINNMRIEMSRIQMQDITTWDEKSVDREERALETLRGRAEAYYYDLLKLDYDEASNYFKEFPYETILHEYHSLISYLRNVVTQNKQKADHIIPLPKLKMSVFNGDYAKWNSFKELFLQVIHRNPKLSAVEKLEYLKAHLSGDPLQLINHLAITSASYEAAWNLLLQRYQNERKIVYSLLDKLFDIKEGRTKPSFIEMADLMREVAQTMEHLECFNGNTFIIYMYEKVMDYSTRSYYEQFIENSSTIPTALKMVEFLQARAAAINANPKNYQNNQNSLTRHQNFRQPFVNKPRKSNNFVQSFKNKCVVCNDQHLLYLCPKFLSMTPLQRKYEVTKKRLCYNCLNEHSVKECNSNKTCKECGKFHHTLIHIPPKQSQVNLVTALNVLLATAIVKIQAKDGTWVPIRILIDMGAQGSFITEDCVQKLQLSKKRTHINVVGMGETAAGDCNKMVSVVLSPHFASNYRMHVKAFVMKKLVGQLPTQKFEINNRKVMNLKLADPHFNIPAKVHMLVGADVYSNILITDKFIHGEPSAQNTQFGYILFGNTAASKPQKTFSLITTMDLSKQLKKFWELESIPEQKFLSTDDMMCEQIYSENVTRARDGRYIVKIPFYEDKLAELGDSRSKAYARLLQMERKLDKNPSLKESYVDFMRTYEKLNHMTEVPTGTIKYFFSHHGVERPESTTCPLRVVFDGSATSSTGLCINDCMYNGQKLQKDIFEILLKWRQRKIAVVGDIEKMYRQILVTDEDKSYQGILWRENPGGPVKEYVLNTVTYGTRSAPFLSIRTLHQLAKDIDNEQTAKLLTENFYVDDLLASFDTTTEAKTALNNIISTLQSAGMPLRKLSSNQDKLFNGLPVDIVQTPSYDIENDETEVKTLGMRWRPVRDIFNFKITLQNYKKRTMRELVADVTSLYDPLGLVSPVIIVAKMLIQKGWKLKLKWDDPLPEEIVREWEEYRSQLGNLSEFIIKRWIKYRPTAQIEVHGFCDASLKAYSAVVYIKTTYKEVTEVILLTSKTKVAPLATHQSLAKLELESASLLVDIITVIRRTMEFGKNTPYFAWSDSEITLDWIAKEPYNWKTFVANRVAAIQTKAEYLIWNHVSGKMNPADLGSRGLTVKKLLESDLWFHGPEFLKKPSSEWPKRTIQPTTLEAKIHTLQIKVFRSIIDFTRFSSYYTLIRTIACCLRWKTKQRGFITGDEMSNASKIVVKFAQDEMVGASHLEKLSTCNKKFKSLTPLIDENGIIRVGGRLQQSILAYNEQHPIILDDLHPFSKLLCKHIHQKHGHCGTGKTMAFIRQEFFITRCRLLVKNIIKKCVLCTRLKAVTQKQIMCELPKNRVVGSIRPFVHVALDYFGPLNIRMSPGRGAKTIKAYGCIITCLASRAVHLELVIGLEAKGLLNALTRFMARRGLVKTIYSDNGTNMVKAKRMLNEDYQKAVSEAINYAAPLLANQKISWNFSCPSSPFKNGLTEIMVKFSKQLMKTLIGDVVLTYEEMSTFFCSIEAILNSRPLCTINEDTEQAILTPAKLIIGENLTSVVEPIVEDINVCQRFLLLKQLKQEFWKQWSSEYLHTLQKRTKWQTPAKNMEIGQIVLIKDERLPPLNWIMGKILEIFPSPDGHARVARVKTSIGELKRPVQKLVLLPTDDEQPKNLGDGDDDDVSKNHQEKQQPKKQPIPVSTRVLRSHTKFGSFTSIIMMLLFFLISGCRLQTISIKYPIHEIKNEVNYVSDQLYMAEIMCGIGWSLPDKERCAAIIPEFRKSINNLQNWIENISYEDSDTFEACTSKCHFMEADLHFPTKLTTFANNTFYELARHAKIANVFTYST